MPYRRTGATYSENVLVRIKLAVLKDVVVLHVFPSSPRKRHKDINLTFP